MNGLAQLEAQPPDAAHFTTTIHTVPIRSPSSFATLPRAQSTLPSLPQPKTDANHLAHSHYRVRSKSSDCRSVVNQAPRTMKKNKPLPARKPRKHRPPPPPPSAKKPVMHVHDFELHPIQFDMHRQRSLPPQLDRTVGPQCIDQSPVLKPHRYLSASRKGKALPPMLKDHRSAPPPVSTKPLRSNSYSKELVASSVPVPPLTDLHNCIDSEHKSDKDVQTRGYSIVKSVPSLFQQSASTSTDVNITSPSAGVSNNTRQFGLLSPKGSHQGFATANDTRASLIQAQCQCGGVRFELLAVPQELQHCYCSMCRKMHGAASATWTPLLESDIRFIAEGTQTKYHSSDNVVRSFCSVCGSNISLKYKFQADTIWMTPALFESDPAAATEAQSWWKNARVLHIFCGSKCEWYQLPNDGNPQLSETDILNSEVDGEPVFLFDHKTLPPKKPLMHSH